VTRRRLMIPLGVVALVAFAGCQSLGPREVDVVPTTMAIPHCVDPVVVDEASSTTVAVRVPDWISATMIANAIDAVPAWDRAELAAPDAWSRLVRVASLLNRLEDDTIRVALILHTERHKSMLSRDSARSRAFLLFRVLFDFGECGHETEQHSTSAIDDACEPRGLIQLLSTEPTRDRARFTVADPIRWVDGNPTISALPIGGIPRSGRTLYLPDDDFAELARLFSRRSNLVEIADRLESTTPISAQYGWQILAFEFMVDPLRGELRARELNRSQLCRPAAAAMESQWPN